MDRAWPHRRPPSRAPFRLLCEALGRPELADDPRFSDYDRRLENFRELIDLYDEAFAGMTWEEWEQKIREYDLISCRVNDLRDLQRDEQILANEYLVKLPHPELGEWWYAPTPVRFEKTPVEIRSEAPHVGQHTNEIRRGLGYTNAQIDALRARAVV